MDMALIVCKDLEMLKGMLPSQSCHAGLFLFFNLIYVIFFRRDGANTELPRGIVSLLVLLFTLSFVFGRGACHTKLPRGSRTI